MLTGEGQNVLTELEPATFLPVKSVLTVVPMLQMASLLDLKIQLNYSGHLQDSIYSCHLCFLVPTSNKIY